MIAEGTSDELKAQIGGERLEVRLEDPADAERAIAVARRDVRRAAGVEDGIVARRCAGTPA